MRQILIRQAEDGVNFKATLTQMLTFTNDPNAGFSMEEVAKCVRLRKTLADVELGELWTLDEDDWTFVRDLYSRGRFVQALDGLVELSEALTGAKRLPPDVPATKRVTTATKK